MPRHNILIVLVLSLGCVAACKPSNPLDMGDQGDADGADAQGSSAPLLFGPDGFSSALMLIQNSTTCSVMEEQWQVKSSGSGLNTLAFVAKTTNVAENCFIKIDVPITNKVDFTKYPTGLISFDTNYVNSNGSMGLQVNANGIPTVYYAGMRTGTKQSQSQSLVGRFDTAKIQSDKLTLTFGIDFPSTNRAIFDGDGWIVSNVSAYAAQ